MSLRVHRGYQHSVRVLTMGLLFLLGLGTSHSPIRATGRSTDARITISIVGTSDLHGFVFDNAGRGGLALLGGYIRNLRAARAADGGAVILLDSGDTYQGGIESDMSEGALVVDAYNALGYAAGAIGNHDFDFGAIDPPGPQRSRALDLRGALKARAAQARYPLLAANLLDSGTGRPVDWPNVQPSIMVDAAGIKVGLIGVMTVDALRATLAANVQGLALAPLAPTIVAEATRLRARGAAIVVVAAHAGARCTQFNDPTDLSSCSGPSEIFDVARALPHGLVDAIAAGHAHEGLAHLVNGVAIVEAYSQGRAFGRIDLVVDRDARRIGRVRVFPPRDVCAAVQPGTTACAAVGAAGVQSEYEGRPVTADQSVASAMVPALTRVRTLRSTPLAVVLDTPIARTGDPESPLGNLFASALLAMTPGADVAINNNGRGGLRADLPAGPLTYGALYDVFPFDNRAVVLPARAVDLMRIFGDEIEQGRRGGLGIAGIRVEALCSSGGVEVRLRRESGDRIDADETLRVATTDQLAGRGLFSIFGSDTRRDIAADPAAPILREIVAEWLQHTGGHISERQFADLQRPRWTWPFTRLPGSPPCRAFPQPSASGKS